MVDCPEKVNIIVPNAKISDDVYFFLPEDLRKSVNLFTISTFLKRHIKDISRKSDLLILLSSTFKRFFPEEGFDLFYRTFELFTELRSYTLTLEPLQDVLSGFDPKIEKCFLVFWQIFEQLEIIDEQKSYELMATVLSKEETEIQGDSFFVLGFNFLSNNQLKMFERIALRNNVYFPLSEYVFENLSDQDWPRWLQNPELKKLKPKREDVGVNPAKRFNFSGAYLNQDLLEYLKTEGKKSENLILAKDTIELKDILALPIGEMKFKTGIEIFNETSFKINKILRANKSIEQNIGFLKTKNSQFLENQDFKSIKIVSILLKNLYSLCDYLGKDFVLDEFYIQTLNRCLDLDTPRLSLEQVTNPQKNSFALNALDSDFLKLDSGVFIAKSDMGIKGGGTNVDFEIEKKLMVLGPIKRQALSELYFISRFQNLISSGVINVFWEQYLEEKDPLWNKIYSLFHESFDVLVRPKKNNSKVDIDLALVKDNKVDSFSYSKLQTFLECPRKYYFQYLNKISIDSPLKRNFEARVRGTIIHEVIGVYCKKYGSEIINEENLEIIVNDHLNEQISLNQMNVSKQRFLTSSWEIFSFARNGIKVLNQFFKSGYQKHQFEEPLNLTSPRFRVSGSIDCVISGENTWGIIDFKRSSGGIPTLKAINNFKNIQLWFYFKYYENLHLKGFLPSFMGYVDLSDPGKSVYFYKKDQVDLKNFLGKGRFYEVESWEEKLDDFNVSESELINSIKSESEFPPQPVSSNACMFCNAKPICPQGVLS